LTIGGYSGSKDPESSNLKRKQILLLQEGVIFENETSSQNKKNNSKEIKISEKSLFYFDQLKTSITSCS
jgi:hypothetical protein